jgi:hypothetical protein
VTLDELGLCKGEKVRYRRRRTQGRWDEAVVVGMERDGSLGVRDQKGAARAIPLELVEVRAEGPRGARLWEPLLDRAHRAEQRSLF